ncbi:hypothetical protein ACYOEI_11355 [Singulisphaera rosea]
MGGMPAAQPKSIETELLEMEQEADKTALKEALVLQARQDMKSLSGPEQQVAAEQAKTLADFIDRKKKAIIGRNAELRELRNPKVAAAAAAAKPAQFDWRAAIEKSENARIESQLHQAQVSLLEPELASAIEELAGAEHAAGKDEKLSAKADEARKAYEKIKAQYLEHSKQLRLEQQEAGGMGGGMGGMGGQGMR